ncbi:DUF1549 and DUF1553 domain-containing protein [Lignipirellula cremea]|uniref:BIG2 domain-containing protein n=1 Tax=Lignipirellula cremea TaxID=2528010 RepID=A0A518DSA8_9BACT|nr:DUF1549 and DUF1553 domain-containing protein [Lignipirellula cremea]QDU94668.1 hypothetical protein Pla8534_24740 [Lignipirellula cremea]
MLDNAAQVIRQILLACAAGLLSLASPPGGSSLGAGSATAAPPPDFLTEVMPVFAKGGCNMGACHGNLNGKGGFKLSLRGEDPQTDYLRLTREFAGRRVNRLQPKASLILLKPTSQVSHQGGKRFAVDSPAWRLLADWIAAGAPGPQADSPQLVRLVATPAETIQFAPHDHLQLHVTAHFDNGEQRDVTSQAVYDPAEMRVAVSETGLVQRQDFGETTVLVRFLDQHAAVRVAFMSARPDFVWSDPPVANLIDRLVDARIRPLKINPSSLADDGTFLRRAFLDAIGLPPTAAEARAFVADANPNKRSQVIDALLLRPEFADHWALKWADLLKNEERVLDTRGVEAFHSWIRDSIDQGKPVDQFTRELLTTQGSTYERPATNFWRANRDPLTRGETVARLFLGSRLLCAKCHNHPFEHWKQDEYYDWATVFSQIDYLLPGNQRTDKRDKNEFIGEQFVYRSGLTETTSARTGEPAQAKFLGSDETPSFGIEDDRLLALADWLTSPQNKQFARTQANLVWYHLLGRGLVEPLDDFRETNPPANPELLDALAEEFIRQEFDLRSLVRMIMNSRTYQLSSEPNETNAGDTHHFSHATVRRLTAEQLLDAQSSVLGAAAEFAGYESGIRAGQLPGVYRVQPREVDGQKPGDRFLRVFGKPARQLGCECERSNETTLSQTFALISGDSLHQRLTSEENRLAEWASSERTNATIIDELFWSALSRPPTASEQAACAAALEMGEDRLPVLQDLAWAVMNSKEFLFRH